VEPDKSDNLLVKSPSSPASIVLSFKTVGVELVLQHTPRSVTVLLPLLATVPPQIAEDEVISLTGNVLTVGASP